MAITHTEFSEFELLDQRIKFSGENSFVDMHCVGTSEEELDVKIIKKMCRGKKRKEVVHGGGTGKLKQSLHCPVSVYNKMYDMTRSTLKTGVYAYGLNSSHPTFSLTQQVVDEDGNVKLKAYPKCIMESGPKRKIENGAEEVAEIELEISIMPDDNGECVYEAYASEATGITAESWLSSFSDSMVKKTS